MPVIVTPVDTTAAITDFQYQLENPEGTSALRFGRGTQLTVQSFDKGSPDVRDQTSERLRESGSYFGEDFFNSRTLTWSASALIKAGTVPQSDVLDTTSYLAERFEGAWRNPDLLGFGRYGVLRYNRGRGARRVYGRPRQFTTTEGRAHQGLIPVTASFECVDHQSYDDLVSYKTVNAFTAQQDGLVEPLVDPLTASSELFTSDTLEIEGPGYSWPVATFYGPVVNPSARILGAFNIALNYTVAHDEYVTVCPEPWDRYVVSNLHGHVKGKLSPQSPPLASMQLKPGEYVLDFGGVSPTNTAQLLLTWRNGRPSI